MEESMRNVRKSESTIFLLDLYSRQKKKITISILLTIFSTIIGIMTPLLIMHLIDEIVPKGNLTEVYIFCLGVTVLFLFYSLFIFLSNYLEGKIVFESNRYLRKKIMDKVRKGTLESVRNSRKHGELTQVINHDVPVCQVLLFTAIVPIFTQLSAFIFIFIIILKIHVWLSLLLCLFIPLYYINFRFFTKKITRANEEILSKRDQSSIVIQDIHQNMNIFKLTNKENEYYDTYNQKVEEAYSAQSRGGFLYSIFNSSTVLVQSITLVCVLCFGGYSVITETISLGAFIAVCMYITRFFTPIDLTLKLLLQVKTYNLSINKVLHYISLKPEATGVLQLSNVEELHIKQYVMGNVQIKDWYFEKGNIHLIKGRNGIGKSTLIHSIVKLEPVQDGAIFVNKLDINELVTTELRQRIYVCFQTPQFLAKTIRAQLRYMEKISLYRNVKKQSSLYENAKELLSPFDYDKNIDSFSGGEKQLISIAIGIMSNPSILILDETFSNLDHSSIMKVLRVLQNVQDYITIIIVTHDPRITVQNARVFQIEEVENNRYIS